MKVTVAPISLNHQYGFGLKIYFFVILKHGTVYSAHLTSNEVKYKGVWISFRGINPLPGNSVCIFFISSQRLGQNLEALAQVSVKTF